MGVIYQLKDECYLKMNKVGCCKYSLGKGLVCPYCLSTSCIVFGENMALPMFLLS